MKDKRYEDRVLRILRVFCPEYLLEEIEGDLIQKYHSDTRLFGPRTAKQRLLWNMLRFLQPGIVLRNRITPPLTNTIMLRNYFKISLRSLLAHKTNSFINSLGLVTGIAVSLVILIIIRYELSFDSYHTKADRTFRIVTISETNGEAKYNPGLPYPFADGIRHQITSVEAVTALHYQRELQVDVLDPKGTVIKKFYETDGCALVEPSFFEVFDFQGTDFQWLSGNPQTALSEPFSIVLTRSSAEKYFSTLDVLGKTLRVEQQLDFKVTGVIEDLPHNTDFPFIVLLSYSTFHKIQEDQMKNDWRSVARVNQCFITVSENIGPGEIEEQIGRMYAAHVPEEIAKAQRFELQSLAEVHRDSRFGNFNLRTVSDTMLFTLAIAGIVSLLLACINYVNLATAQSSLRSKEIGIRKVLGSRRRQLIFQFLCEAFLIALFSSILALLAAQLLLATLEPLINIRIDGFAFLDWNVLNVVAGIVLFITLFAGLYPAMAVSGFNPVKAMKMKLTNPGTGVQLRKTLVVLQFTVTQIFIIGTFVVLNQVTYFKNADLGFEKTGIINVALPIEYQGRLQRLEDRLTAIPSISQLSFSSSAPAGLRRATWSTSISRKEASFGDAMACEYQAVDHRYIELYGLKLIAGRNFSADDSSGYLVINESLSRSAGFANPEEAIGREMVMDTKPYTIIGVVANFHSRSLKEELDKVAFAVHPHMYRLASIKFNLSRDEALPGRTIDEIASVWSSNFPETIFDYRFVDENVNAYYEQENKISKLLQIFSGVLLIIGCLGLYGLISFVVNRNLKEIAVRKVFGASMLHVMSMISKDYFRLILLAFALAAPVAYYYLDKWLSTYVYRIQINWWLLVTPALIVAAVALLAIAGQLLRAARTNPADTLKYE